MGAPTHRVSEGTMVWEILDDWMIELYMVSSFNGKVVGMHDTMRDFGIGHDCTLRCTRRIRGGAQRFRQPQPDIPGQWTCSACGQERGVAGQKSLHQVWVCSSPYAVGPTGRPPQRSNPVNPTYRPNQRPPQPVCPDCFGARAIAGWSCRCSCVWFCSHVPSGKFGLAEELLAANLEPRGLFEIQVLFWAFSSERGGSACVATGQQDQRTGQCLGAD